MSKPSSLWECASLLVALNLRQLADASGREQARRGTRRRASSRTPKGFTLIEALAAIAILGVGVVAAMGGLSTISRSEARARDLEKMHRLAMQKYDEMRTITDTFAAGQQGDFSEEGEPDYVWELEVEPTGIENLDTITINVERRGQGGDNAVSESVSGLVFQPPQEEQQQGAVQ